MRLMTINTSSYDSDQWAGRIIDHRLENLTDSLNFIYNNVSKTPNDLLLLFMLYKPINER